MYLKIEAAISELCADVMHAIGAESDDPDLVFDPAAEELFGNTRSMEGQIIQELADHVYRSTRRYLEAKAAAAV